MIGAYLTYGLALSGEFGSINPALTGRPKTWMEALIEREGNEEAEAARAFVENHCVRQPTVEDPWIVAGILVDEEQMDDLAYVGALRSRWDERMADVDADIRASLLELGSPKVQMIYGEF
jgi:hypothetical protein